ncbi:MAG: Hsp20/alpha crystallin family protein [Nitrospinae bacterium]|nr:Hsp20/alpha crystallin family protein [Nitrospinota bacterium]
MSSKEAIQKQETKTPEGVERTKAKRTFAPVVDIIETEKEIVLMADMPGVDENSVDITLEKNVLAINGGVEEKAYEGHSLAYSEYRTGDYARSFTLADEIDKDNIKATVKNGVLRLVLPKAKPAAKKIAVKAA